jgi:hypothetical protein
LIPPLIHYCWFGNNPLDRLAEKCIASWKTFFPNHEIKAWNDSNYDVSTIPYAREAYAQKKYAFVSDYVRFDVLYRYGGIYFDTDVEVIRSFDSILQNGPFMGVEEEGRINAGLGCGFEKKMPILREILDLYAGISFVNPDVRDTVTVVDYITLVFRNRGFDGKGGIQMISGITVYPEEYFNPVDYDTHYLNITTNTCSIHHGAASWVGRPQRTGALIHRWLCRVFGKRRGRAISSFVRKTGKNIYRLFTK